MTTRDVYVKLRIPPNLQEHMLRVAALLKILTDNWKGAKLESQALIKAGLCHDLGNILKFNFSLKMLGSESDRVDYWKKVQTEVRQRYGSDIHQATLSMSQEIGLDKETLRIIDSLEWDRIQPVMRKSDWLIGLAIYADMRIGPFGILPLVDRIENLHQRRPFSDFESILTKAKSLESELAHYVTIPLNGISDESLNRQFSELLNWQF